MRLWSLQSVKQLMSSAIKEVNVQHKDLSVKITIFFRFLFRDQTAKQNSQFQLFQNASSWLKKEFIIDKIFFAVLCQI